MQAPKGSVFVLAVFLLALLPCAAAAGPGDSGLGCSAAPSANPELWRPYVGVYEDVAHADLCVTVPLYQFLYLYVWWRPGSRGMISNEFKIDIPDAISLLAIFPNSSISDAGSKG